LEKANILCKIGMLILSSVILLTGGCQSTSDNSGVERQLQDLTRQVTNLSESLSQRDEQIEDLLAQLEEKSSEIEDLKAELDELKDKGADEEGLQPSPTPTPSPSPSPTVTPTPATVRIGVIYSSSYHHPRPIDLLDSRRIQFTDIGDDFATINFSDYDILIVSDIGSLAPQFSPSAIHDFVSQGGILFFGPLGFNGTYGRSELFQRDLYPYPLYIKELSKIRMSDYLTWIEKLEHPIFSGFGSVKSIDNSNWQPPAVQVTGYGATQWVWVFADADSHYDVLLNWGTSSQQKSERFPILLEAKLGKGTMLISQIEGIFQQYNEDLATTKLSDNVIDYLITLSGKPAPKY
jgi:hypothetical protein